jgi:adenylate kinase
MMPLTGRSLSVPLPTGTPSTPNWRADHRPTTVLAGLEGNRLSVLVISADRWSSARIYVTVSIMRKYVLMGAQGSGKGTQAAILARDFDMTQISVGDIFRWHVQNHTKLGAQVRRIMAAGELVGDDLVEKVVHARLDEHDWNYGFVIDGFPRNQPQAMFFLERYDIDAVIHLDLPDEEVRRRVLARRLCSNCRLDYNLMAHRPEVEGRCDVCGGELVQREDDTEEALATRLKDYHEKTDPVLDLFRRKEFVVTVDARPNIAAVQNAIRSELNLPPYKPSAA